MPDEKALIKSVTYFETEPMNAALEAIAALLHKRGPPALDGMVMLRVHRTRRKVSPSELRRHMIRRGIERFAEMDPEIADLPEVKECLASPYYIAAQEEK